MLLSSHSLALSKSKQEFVGLSLPSLLLKEPAGSVRREGKEA